MRNAVLPLLLFAAALVPVSASASSGWGNHSSTLPSRLARLKLHALPTEGAVEHIHAHVDVYVSGKKIVVPAYVGINFQHQFITELHTHDTSGILHIESPKVRPFTLGQFFGEWDVKLSSRCIGSTCGVVHTWVNGKARSGDPASLVLEPHEEIAVAVGPPPFVVPKHYSFPLGY